MIELQELLIPFLAGLFPSLMAVIPVIITSVKNIKVNKNVKDLQELFKGLSLDTNKNKEIFEQAATLAKQTAEHVDFEIKEIYSIAKKSIVDDVTILTKATLDSSDKLISVANNMTKETRMFIESMKKQILDDLEKEIKQIVDNVVKIREERQDQVSSD